jgi:hypothetical protein
MIDLGISVAIAAIVAACLIFAYCKRIRPALRKGAADRRRGVHLPAATSGICPAPDCAVINRILIATGKRPSVAIGSRYWHPSHNAPGLFSDD